MATEDYGINFKQSGGQALVDQFRGIEKSSDDSTRALNENAKVIDRVKAASDAGRARLAALSAQNEANSASAKKAAVATGEQASALTKLEAATKSATSSLNTIKSALAGAFALAYGKQIIAYIDDYTNLRNQIRLVAKDNNDLEATYKTLLGVANRSRQDVDATVKTYSLLRQATESLKIKQEDVVRSTESIAKIFTIAGTTAETAKLALVQFSQGIGLGVLKGQELNSVLLGTNGAFARLIAPALKAKGIIADQEDPVSGLKRLAAQGLLTSKVVIEALTKGAKSIDAAFAKIQPSISSSLTVLNNNLTDFIGNTDKAYGVSAYLGKAILYLADNIDIVAIAFVGFTALLAAAAAFGAVTTIIAGLTTVVTALGGALLFLAANPIVLVIAGVVAIVGYFVGWKNLLNITISALTQIGAGLLIFGKNILEAAKQTGVGAEAIYKYFADAFTNAWNAAVKFVSDVYNTLAALPGQTVTVWNAIVGAVDTAFNQAVQAVRKFAQDAYNYIAGKFKEIADYISNSWVGIIISAVQKGIAALQNLIRLQSQAAAGAPSAPAAAPGTPTAFRDGGDFKVPGAGGVDSKLIQFMASPGEHITVETPLQKYANDNVPHFRDGGVVQQGNGGGGSGVSNRILIQMLGELRGIRRALGGSAGSTGGSSGSSSRGSSGSSSGSSGSVVGFNPGSLYSPTTPTSPAGGTTATGGTELQALAAAILSTEGAPTPTLNVTWGLDGQMGIPGAPLATGLLYSPSVQTNADTFDDYMGVKGGLINKYVGQAKGLPKDMTNELKKMANTFINYGDESLDDDIKYAYFQKQAPDLQPLKDLVKQAPNLAQVATSGLAGLSAFLTDGLPSVSATVPAYPGYNPGGIYGYGPGLKTPGGFLGGGGADATSVDGGGATALFGQELSTFRDGGDFRVPGAGGVDSRNVQFMATPGEHVSVKTPGQKAGEDRQGRGDTHNSFSVTIVTPDANSFARNKKQTELTLKNVLSRVAA